MTIDNNVMIIKNIFMKIIVTFISDYKVLISNYLIIISMAAQTIIQITQKLANTNECQPKVLPGLFKLDL